MGVDHQPIAYHRQLNGLSHFVLDFIRSFVNLRLKNARVYERVEAYRSNREVRGKVDLELLRQQLQANSEARKHAGQSML